MEVMRGDARLAAPAAAPGCSRDAIRTPTREGEPMTRFGPFTGPGDLLVLVALGWLTAAGVVLAWVAAGTGSDSGLRAALGWAAGGSGH